MREGETSAHQEIHELEGYTKDHVGFSGRFLMGESYQNPDERISQEISEQQMAISPDRFSLANKAVLSENTSYWETKAQTGGPSSYNDQKELWVQNTADTFTHRSSEHYMTALKPILEKISGTTYQTIDTTIAKTILQTMHSKYFESSAEHPVDMYSFVQDTMQAYTNQADHTVNIQELLKNLPSISWLCGIFGDKHMNQISTDILAACAQYAGKKEELLQNINQKQNASLRIDTPNLQTKEKEALAYLWTFHTPEPIPAPTISSRTDQSNPNIISDTTILTGDDKEKNKSIEKIKQDIFEQAGKRNKEDMETLLSDVSTILEQHRHEADNKLPHTIQEAEAMNFSEIIHDGNVTYIPKGEGEIISIGDLHGDFSALKSIIEETKFIENMESGDKSKILVIKGDVVDRGKKDIETEEVIMDLKRRYPKNIIYIKADHETDTGISHHDYPERALMHYYKNGIPIDFLQNFIPKIKNVWEQNTIFNQLAQSDIIDKDDIQKYIVDTYKKQLSPISLKQSQEQVLSKISNPQERDEIQQIFDTIHTSIAENNPLFRERLYKGVWERLPRLVVCGNGVAIVHGGPARESKTIKEYAQIRDPQNTYEIFDRQITWADPDPMLDTYIAQNQGIISTIDTLITQAQNASNKKASYHSRFYDAPTLLRIKNRINDATKKHLWFNTRRVQDGELFLAVLGDSLLYGEQATVEFLQKMGASVMLRGHETTEGTASMKKNPFESNIVFTIHSTGEGSPDTAYQGREPNPVYAVLPRNVDIQRIDPNTHIRNVWH